MTRSAINRFRLLQPFADTWSVSARGDLRHGFHPARRTSRTG